MYTLPPKARFASSVGNGLFNSASLDLQFAKTKSLVDATTGINLIDFTRASSGTYVGSDGLIETATTNLLLRSEEFDQSPWASVRSTIASNAITSPNGALTADKLIASTDPSTSHYIRQSLSLSASQVYNFTVYAKAAEYEYLSITTFGSNGWSTTTTSYFDLVNGAVTPSTTGIASITNVGDGWYRINHQATKDATSGSSNIDIYVSNSGSSTSYTGDGTSGIYIWGAQLEQSSTVGEYIKTTSTINSAPRFDHDPTTGESLGLLVEESRTNLVPYSEEFDSWSNNSVSGNLVVTPNAALSPDNKFTADRITKTDIFRYLEQAHTASTSIDYTFSAYAKAGDNNYVTLGLFENNKATTVYRVVIDLSDGSDYAVFGTGAHTVTNIGNGWYRIALTGQFSVTNTHSLIYPGVYNVNTGDCYIWGAQLEAGSFPTSYIPTEGTTVTRAADVASISGSNWSSWGSSTTGTYYLEAVVTDSSNPVTKVFLGSSSSPAESYYLYQVQNQSDLRTFDSTSVLDTGNTISDGITFKGGMTYSSANSTRSLVLNGGTVAEGAFDGIYGTDLSIGSRIAGRNFITGTIRRLTYWPTRLPNETLQTITQ